MTGNGMVRWLRVGWVVVLGGAVVSLSCACGVRRAAGSDDLEVFLAGFRRAVIAGDTGLILEVYIDPGYRAEQLEGLLEGDEGQFFDELFGLGRRRFGDIVDLEYVCEEIVFEVVEYRGAWTPAFAGVTKGGDGGAAAPDRVEGRLSAGVTKGGDEGSDIAVGKCGVVVTYADGGRVEDWVFVVRYGDGGRRFGIEGPRG